MLIAAVEGSGSASPVPVTSSTSTDATGVSGLAPPLPQTTLGQGASHGATDVEAIPGISPEGSAKSSMLSAPPANERTDSFASTTAIRHGHEGSSKHESSPLAAAPVVAAIDEKPTPVEEPRESEKGLDNEVSSATSPSAKTEAITASPSTKTEPAPVAAATPSKTSTSAIADSPTKKTTPLPASANAHNGHASPVSKTAASDASHRRTSSNSSNGKKKAGFMSKLKGEMKVISGKLGGDEAKVQAGERMKHGG